VEEPETNDIDGGPAAGPVARRAWPPRRLKLGVGAYRVLLGFGALIFGVVLAAIIVTLFYKSRDAWSTFGLGFVWSRMWDPVHSVFGALPFIVGTLTTTAIALVVSIPVGIACAAYLTELAPRWLRPFGVLVDLIAAIPSVVIGLWGLLVVTPVFGRDVEPFMKKIPVIEWFFHGTPFGVSIFLAGVILAIMVIPTIVALSRTALLGVGVPEREAGMALGATPWRVVRSVVVPGSRSGIVAAVVLALGRAVGETIAVTLVIGNNYVIPHSLLAPGATLGSVIVNQFGDASTVHHELGSLVALGVILLAMGLVINGGGQMLLRGRRRPADSPVAEVVA
jgi:phosphate transport system permease protein